MLKLKQFRGSAATVKIIRVFDRLFDILNSRNPCARGFKSALRVSNKEAWGPFLSDAFEYILHLKDSNGQPMYTTRRKTGFVGFLVAIESTKGIFHDLVKQHQAPLKYLLTYKMSQDHLELFFGAVCSAGGFNNNPTGQQFTAAYNRRTLGSRTFAARSTFLKLKDMGGLFKPTQSVIKISEETERRFQRMLAATCGDRKSVV